MADVTYLLADFTGLAPGETFPSLGALYGEVLGEPSLAAGFDRVVYEDPLFIFTFSSALTGGQQANLDALVASHLGIDPSEDLEEDFEGLSFVNVDEINGVNFSNFVNGGTTHISDTTNPHGTDLGNLGSGTLAELNNVVTDATLDGTNSQRNPLPHAGTHSQAGPDPISIQDLSSGAAPSDQIFVSDGSGGLNTIELPEIGDVPAFSGVFISGTATLPDTFTPVSLGFRNTIATSNFSHTIGDAAVTITETGLYSVTGYATLGLISGNDRSTGEARVTRSISGGAFNEINGMRGGLYTREILQDVTNASFTQVLLLNAGDQIRLETRRRSGPDTLTNIADQCGLVIQSQSGARGPKGDTGLGTSLDVQNDGLLTAGGPFSTLNFTGVPFNLTNSGGGVVDIEIDPDPLGAALEVFAGVSNVTVSNLPTSFITIPLTDRNVISAGFTHTLGGAEVTVVNAGRYVITGYTTTDISSGSGRSVSEMRVTRDDGSGTFAIIPGMLGGMYHRTSTAAVTNASVSQIVELNAGDRLRLEVRQSGGSSPLETVAGACGLTAYRLRALAATAPSGGTGEVSVQEDGVLSGDYDTLNFTGAPVSVTDLGSGRAQIDVDAAGSTHASTHTAGGADALNVQDLGSGAAPADALFVSDGSGGVQVINEVTLQDQGSDVSSAGKILETDGVGGWVLIDTPVSVDPPRVVDLYADQLDTPGVLTGTDWAVNNGALASSDTITEALIVRRFDDTTPEGVGWSVLISADAAALTMELRSRPQTAPATSEDVVLELYYREISLDGSSPPSAWASTVLPTTSVASSTDFARDVFEINLVGAGINAGSFYQLELVRQAGDPQDTLPGDWVLASIQTRFDRGGNVDAEFVAASFQNPVNTDWVVDDPAVPESDPANAALSVRAFDDTQEEGVGWVQRIPTIANNVTYRIVGRAQTSPASTQGVAFNLYAREVPIGSPAGAWSSPIDLGLLSCDSANYEQLEVNLNLQAQGLTPGRLYVFELTRDAPRVGDDLAGDFLLLTLQVEFTS